MSSEHVTREPITLEQFYEQAAVAGWHHAVVDGRDVVRKAEDSPLVAFDVREVLCTDGQTRVLFTRYAGNDVSELERLFACYREHSCEYYVLFDFADGGSGEVFYEDLPQAFRDDVSTRFKGQPDELQEFTDELVACLWGDSVMPVRHIEMDETCFINGQKAHAFVLHFVHHSDDAYYDQWATQYADNYISPWQGDEELANRWNWCVENLKGPWSVQVERQHQCQIYYNIAILNDDDALRFELNFKDA